MLGTKLLEFPAYSADEAATFKPDGKNRATPVPLGLTY